MHGLGPQRTITTTPSGSGTYAHTPPIIPRAYGARQVPHPHRLGETKGNLKNHTDYKNVQRTKIKADRFAAF